MEKIIFDLDPGVDDAMALIMAFNEPKIEIKMISVVFGNVSVKQATKNALFMVQNFADKDYPVYMGAEKGLKSPLQNASDVHGKAGLGKKIVAKNITKTVSNRKGYGAIEAMRDTIMAEPKKISIVCVGPLTNVATLLTTYPEVIPNIKRIAMEVGSVDGKGSITPYASFNAYCDPEAVDIVIKSGVPITLTTKEIGTYAYFDDAQRKRFEAINQTGQFISDLCEGYKDKILADRQYAVHDTGCLLALLGGTMFTRQNVDMKINTTNGAKRAQTTFVPNDNSHITLVTGVDKKRLLKKMEELVARAK